MEGALNIVGKNSTGKVQTLDIVMTLDKIINKFMGHICPMNPKGLRGLFFDTKNLCFQENTNKTFSEIYLCK